MSAADALNVVGSIGGVANAVSGLTNIASGGSWQASLQQASFGGVPFGVRAAITRAGRRQAVHVYPYRDVIWAEDQGKLPRQFRVSGFLVEDDVVYNGGSVIAQRAALLAVCEGSGPNTLVHPTFGWVPSVACQFIEIEERLDLGRVFEFTMTLIVTGVQQYPSAVQSASDALSAACAALGVASLADFVQTVTADVQQGAAVVRQAVSTVLSYYQLAVGLVNGVTRVFNSVSTLSGNFGVLFGGGNSGYKASNVQASATTTASDLLVAGAAATAQVIASGQTMQVAAAGISDTATYGASVVSFVQAVAASATDPVDGIQMLATLSGYHSDAVTDGSVIGGAMASMSGACAAYMRRAAIAQLGIVAGAYQPSSQNDAVSIQQTITATIDAEILVAGDAGDDASYTALRTLRQTVVAQLQAAGARLAAIATFSFNASLPALTLANRIYRDPSRVDGLVRQVAPVHPAFMPITFDALAS